MHVSNVCKGTMVDTRNTVVNMTNKVTVFTFQTTFWRRVEKLLSQFHKPKGKYACKKHWKEII